MKINKLAIFAILSCLNLCARIYKFDELPPELMAEHGIHKTQNGYVINLDRFVSNLSQPYREYMELNNLPTQGNIPVKQIDSGLLDLVGLALNGNDLTIEMELAAVAFEPKRLVNSIFQIAMDDILSKN